MIENFKKYPMYTGNLMMELKKDLEHLHIQMKMNMKVNGSIIKNMVRVHIHLHIDKESTKVNLKKECIMVKEL